MKIAFYQSAFQLLIYISLDLLLRIQVKCYKWKYAKNKMFYNVFGNYYGAKHWY